MVDYKKRKMLADLLIEYMAGEIKADGFYYNAHKYFNREDPVIMEISYKVLGDRNTCCDHYINIIKEDWHYYVQMVTFLMAGRELRFFHKYDPAKSKAKLFTILLFAIFLPLSLYAWLCMFVPMLLYLFFLPALVMILLSKFIARRFNRRSNYRPEMKLQLCWPYDSVEKFEDDYTRISEHMDIPLAPPSLEGKVEKAKNHNLRWASARPDE